MKTKTIALLLFVAGAICCSALAQQTDPFRECTKAVIGKQKLRVSAGVIQGLVLQKSLPDGSDFKSTKNADVKVKIMIDQTGAVPCATGEEGNPALYRRSVEAAKKWKFKPYILNGEPALVESYFFFRFHKGKVTARFCKDC